jgi:nitroimidazol reductase NimA-like FMN-containing flavoprotein (pyridoxamine 5'-phosphate oxidase superfamily)
MVTKRVQAARSARLATIDPDGSPHLVPIVFVLEGETLYTAVDAKPKRSRRLDRYDEDWRALWWVRLRGRARVLDGGEEAERALALLAAKYEQYEREPPGVPVLAIDVVDWRWWSA